MKKKLLIFGIAVPVGIVVLALVIVLTAAPVIMYRSIQQSFEDQDTYTAAARSLRLMRLFPGSDEARDAAYQLLSMRESSDTYIIVGHNFTLKSHSGLGTLPEEFHKGLYDAVLRVAHAQRNPLWGYNLNERLGKVAASLGEYQQAEEFYTYALENFINRGLDFRAHSIYMSLFDIAMEQGKLDAAQTHIANALASQPTGLISRSELIAREGMLYLELGRYDEAESRFYEAMETAEAGVAEAVRTSEDRGMITTPEAQYGYKISERGLMELDMKLNPQRDTEVHGTIVGAGKPMAGVIVTLMPADEFQRVISPREAQMRYPQTATDSSGEFQFTHIIPGEYTFIFSFKPEMLQGFGIFNIPESFTVSEGESSMHTFTLKNRITITEPAGYITLPYGDTISLSWQPLIEAAEYSINLVYFSGPEEAPYQSSIGVEIDRVTDTRFALETASTEGRSPLRTYAPDRVIPAAVMGPYHPGAYVTFKVIAYDPYGSRITDSEGLVFDRGANYPLWQISDPNDPSLLLDGDRALLNSQIDDAARQYEQAAQAGCDLAADALEALQHYLSTSF